MCWKYKIHTGFQRHCMKKKREREKNANSSQVLHRIHIETVKSPFVVALHCFNVAARESEITCVSYILPPNSAGPMWLFSPLPTKDPISTAAQIQVVPEPLCGTQHCHTLLHHVAGSPWCRSLSWLFRDLFVCMCMYAHIHRGQRLTLDVYLFHSLYYFFESVSHWTQNPSIP